MTNRELGTLMTVLIVLLGTVSVCFIVAVKSGERVALARIAAGAGAYCVCEGVK